jgi:hypothetical protein
MNKQRNKANTVKSKEATMATTRRRTTTANNAHNGPTVSVKLGHSHSEMSSISGSHYDSPMKNTHTHTNGNGNGNVSLNSNVITSRLAQGQCAACGLQTHQLIKKSKGLGLRRSKHKGVTMKMTPLTNVHVYEGRCLLCYPITSNAVPAIVSPLPAPPQQLVRKLSKDTTSTRESTVSGHGRDTAISRAPSHATTGTADNQSQKSALSVTHTLVQEESDGAVEVSLDNHDDPAFGLSCFSCPWESNSSNSNRCPSNLPNLFSRDGDGDGDHNHTDSNEEDEDIVVTSPYDAAHQYDSFMDDLLPHNKKNKKNKNMAISPARTSSTVSTASSSAHDDDYEYKKDKYEPYDEQVETESMPTANTSINTDNRSLMPLPILRNHKGSNISKQHGRIESKTSQSPSMASSNGASTTYTATQHQNWWLPPTPASTTAVATHNKKKGAKATKGDQGGESNAKEEAEEESAANNATVAKAVAAIRTVSSAPRSRSPSPGSGSSSSKQVKLLKPADQVKTITKLMKTHKASVRVQQAACMQLFTLASENAATSKAAAAATSDGNGMSNVHAAMMQYKVIPLILSAMAKFRGMNATEVQIPALGVLYTLVRHSKFQDATREAGGFEILAKTHDEFSHSHTRGHGKMSSDEKLSPQHVEIQKMACITWANLVVSSKTNNNSNRTTTKDHQTLAAKCNAIRLILNSLQNSGRGRPSMKYNPGLSLFAGGALANLGAKHSANLDLIRQEGGVSILEDAYAYFDAMEEENEGDNGHTQNNKNASSSYKPILQLLRAAIGNLEKDAMRFFVQEEDTEVPCYSRDTMQKVVTLMREHVSSSDVVTEGCRLLWHMSASGTVSPNDATKNSTIDDVLRQVGALDVLVETLELHLPSPVVADVACGALWNLTSTSEDNQDHVREVDGIKTLARVLSWYLDPANTHTRLGDDEDDSKKQQYEISYTEGDVSAADVVGNCMCAVANVVAKNMINQTCMRAVGAIPLIVDNMNFHLDMLDVQHFALGALANLSYNHVENSREIVEQGGIDTILHVMERYENHAEIQASACGALSNICAAGGDEARDELQCMDSIHILRDAATNFPKACGKYVDEIVTPTTSFE